MIPMFLKIKIPKKSGCTFSLYFPLFIVWLILLPLAIILFPFIFVAACFTWTTSYGRLLMFLYPMIASVLWHLQGLKIDVQDKNERVYISFI
jgi:hypothetical protein